jgi:NAD(P)-dependent dehydrogenase (short-subunit alcohol dehydrogenase family)
MASFTAKVAIVTGGGSGIGEAVCLDLGRRGARVVVADINGDDAQRVADAITADGGQATARRVDVSAEPDIRRVIEETVAAHGRLDYLFNNAGIAVVGDARDLALDQWRRVVDVDFYGVLHGTLAAYPIMVRQGYGHIVNTASAAGLVPSPGNTPYCAAKHAVVGFSLSMRYEAADLGVKISTVCPGFVRTRIYENTVMVNIPRALIVRQARRMMPADQAARAILRGVQRNRALIVFPGSIRRARRGFLLFPGAAEPLLRTQMRVLRRSQADALKPKATGP